MTDLMCAADTHEVSADHLEISVGPEQSDSTRVDGNDSPVPTLGTAINAFIFMVV